MKADANITQTSELKIFAKSIVQFGRAMVCLCSSGIAECNNAVKATDFWREIARKKVCSAEKNYESAKRELDSYERQNHTDSEGRSTYDSSYASSLRHAVEEAKNYLAMAKEDEQLVLERYQRVRQEASVLSSMLSTAANNISDTGNLAYKQVTRAASTIENKYKT